MDLGGAVEIYPTRRFIVRIDAGETLVSMYDRQAILVKTPTQEVSVLSDGGIRPALQIHVGFGYRLGIIHEETERVPLGSRFEFGPEFTTWSHGSSDGFSSAVDLVTTSAGVGGYFDYALGQHFALDSTLLYFPRREPVRTFQSGGKAFEALFGLKIGMRRGSVGYFFTMRPGLVRYSQTITELILSPPPHFQSSPNTWVAFNIGPAIEVYLSRRTMLRFDVGDTMSFVPSKTVLEPPLPPISYSSDFRHSFQATTGFGFRF
jgi:hypothetical protein